PRWLGRRADLLALGGSTGRARDLYTQALSLIDGYPAARRESRAIVALRDDLRARAQALPG
ncbi:MAG: hypothetical protein K0V04_00465, partial [Deltaproteobacteria bacterium]|nr:hypothetical protein [Deltaproteobacteria bacterium]